MRTDVTHKLRAFLRRSCLVQFDRPTSEVLRNNNGAFTQQSGLPFLEACLFDLPCAFSETPRWSPT